jgi:hypothetical protein
MPSQPLAGLLACAALLAAAAALARLLRAARCPGAAIVAGACAGALLGPTLLGRAAPRLHERAFAGGVAARVERDDAAHELARARAVAEAAAAEHADIPALEARLAQAEERWRDQRRSDQSWRRTAAMVLVVLVLAAARGGPCGQPGAALSIGGWAGALPGAATFALLHFGLDQSAAASALTAAAAAVGPYLLTDVDERAARGAELGGPALIEASGRVATCTALGAAAWGLWRGLGTAGLVAGAPLLMLLVRWFLPRGVSQAMIAVRSTLLLPGLAALVAVELDLARDFRVWPVLLLVLVSGDGRWLGALIGAALAGGRPWMRSMRLVMGMMACGPTQLALALVALHAGAVDGSLALAVLAGALVIEAGVPVRRAMARRVEDIEAGDG